MRNIIQLIALASCLAANPAAAQSSSPKMKELVAHDFKFAAQQYKVLMQKTPHDSMPKTYDPRLNKSVFSNTEWWCSGFYPGALWLIYEQTKDSAVKAEAIQRLAILEKEKFYTAQHDLGFMMFCSFGNAYRITGTPAYKEVLFTSAKSLATRYRPVLHAIQSWDSTASFRCPVIIDNMMNLELLEYVSANGGGKQYAAMAAEHANTTMKNHFRKDYSSYHVLDYDPVTGKVLRKVTSQGAADSSAWARGQGWGLYGYTMMYRFTQDTSYLSFARHIASFILHHPNMPKDMIPYWDFNAPGIPNTYRDVSAAAVIAAALLELGQYVKGKERAAYVAAAETILVNLSTPQYMAAPGSNGGFLLMHSVGALPFKSEVDMPLTYADYYFLEALGRYKKWYL
jgi:unsaturated chondroitin disaccharide hydrolase